MSDARARNVRGQDALATSEARLHALLEAAVDGIISIDAHGTMQTVNSAVERLFGYSKNELIGENVKLLMPAPYREQHDGYLAHYLATGEKRIIGIGREVVGLRKDGSQFPMDLSVAEGRIDGESMFIGIIRDLTIQKRAEAARSQLAALVQSSEDAIVAKSLDGTILTWNAGAERIFGYTADEVVGRHVSILAPPERPCEVRGILDRIKRGESFNHFDTVRIRKDGSRIDVSITISPIKDASGKILGVSAIKRDITAQKRTNEEIRAMTQQLWQAAKLASVGELAASIAHELNNPLATVLLRTESLLAKTSADDPRRKALEIVHQESTRMGELVANLLQFSRRGDGHVSTVEIHEELNKAVELIHHHLRKRLVTVTKNWSPETPTIYADRQKLRQVFLNLLTNAADAMPNGGTLTLNTAPATLKGKPAVSIEVVDTGVGIPADNLERILEPFFTTKEEGKGTGLGLAICRRIIQEHHGTIQVSSEVGKGTAVRTVLPVRNEHNVDRLRSDDAAT